jgi:transposase
MIHIQDVRVYLQPGVTDMRKAINGLSMLVQDRMDLDPFCGHLFVFCNNDIVKAQSRDRKKIGSADVALGYIQKLYRLKGGAGEQALSPDEIRIIKTGAGRADIVQGPRLAPETLCSGTTKRTPGQGHRLCPEPVGQVDRLS